MRPECISEGLLFNTIRLEANDGSCGTGFYFNYKVDKTVYPTIITNKHIVNNNPNEEMSFFVHLDDGNGGTYESLRVKYATNWVFHPTQDLCFCYAAPMFHAVKQRTGKDVFYIANDMNIVATPEKIDNLRPVEAITMIGYPIGLWDAANNLPIFRHGYTASHPAFDFNSPGIGLVDIACFPGSSGSPIYVLDEGSFQDKHGNLSVGMNRIILLGVLFAGPQYMANGKLEIRDIPTRTEVIPQTNLMANLGYYIRAEVLNTFQKYIEKTVQI